MERMEELALGEAVVHLNVDYVLKS
jgi:hypothetical protein